MDVICCRSLTDSCHAGDRCVFTEILLAVPDVGALRLPGENVRAMSERPRQQIGTSGLKEAAGRELGYTMLFLALDVIQDRKRGGESPFVDLDEEGMDLPVGQT